MLPFDIRRTDAVRLSPKYDVWDTGFAIYNVPKVIHVPTYDDDEELSLAHVSLFKRFFGVEPYGGKRVRTRCYFKFYLTKL